MKYLIPLLALTLTACAGGDYKDYLRMRNLPVPTVENFGHCYNYGCKTRAIIQLPDETKNKLVRLFSPKPKTEEEERHKISKSIKIFEEDIGQLTGTKNDKYGTFRLYQDDAKSTRSFQQDCIDESTNTTTYLALLEQLNLLQFHHPAFPASRQPFISGAPWWHQTATIQNIQTKERYAVDSWFRDNGHSAFIVPLKDWKNGWTPPKIKPNQ